MDYIWTTNLKMHPLHLLDLIYFCAEEIREGEINMETIVWITGFVYIHIR